MKNICLIAAAAAMIHGAAAVGNAVVRNNCAFPVTVWSVGSTVSAGHTLKTGQTYKEKFAVDPKTGGRALKVTRDSDGLFTGDPETIYAYTLQGNTIWYDLSDVFGDAFSGQRTVVYSADKSCPPIVWTNGIPPAGSQVKDCQAGSDVTLSLCAK